MITNIDILSPSAESFVGKPVKDQQGAIIGMIKSATKDKDGQITAVLAMHDGGCLAAIVYTTQYANGSTQETVG